MRLVLTTLVVLAFAGMLSGCEYFEEEPRPTVAPNDPAASRIGGVITAAIDSYNTYGPSEMYELLALDVTLVCDQEAFVADMADAVHLQTLRRMKYIDFTDEGYAKVTLDVITPDGDIEQVWTMALARNNVWQILDLPGMSDCKVA